jgi:hypothetical protein
VKRLLILVALTLVGVSVSAADMQAARRAAADRPRTLVFNNDGNEPVYLMTEPTAENLLACRTAPLAGSGVRSIFYSSWSSPFDVFTHHTRVGERFETREGRFSNNQTRALFEAGIDPLAVVAEWCRKHDVECFWSMRMNDTHDSNGEDYAPLVLATSSLKRDHPDWLLGTPERKPPYARWTAVDYGRPEIRDLAFRYVEEVCSRYDVDGVELDFLRHAAFFAAPARGEHATVDDLAAMTGLVRRIRTMADEVGARRGRPILLAVRVPDSLEYARAIGLDLEAWLGGGLVDLLVTTSYIQLNPWEYSVALGQRHGVKVYPSLDECRFADREARRERMTVEAYRARAAAAWAAGVDGIYLFNQFDMQSPVWNELGDRRKLAALDKDYFASYRGPGGTPYPRRAFQNLPTLSPSAPLAVEPGWATKVDLFLGDEFAADASRRPAATLRLALPGIETPDDVTVTCNGTAVTGGRIVAGPRPWLEIPVDAALLRPGRNVVALEPVAGSPVTTWADLGLRVRFAEAGE